MESRAKLSAWGRHGGSRTRSKCSPSGSNARAASSRLPEKFPTGYTRMIMAVIRGRAATSAGEAVRLLNEVTLADNDVGWLPDMRILAQAEIAHRFGETELEHTLVRRRRSGSELKARGAWTATRWLGPIRAPGESYQIFVQSMPRN